MWELFKAELLRFRVWGIAAAVVHMLLLGFSARLVDLAQQPLGVYRGLAAVYALLGLLLLVAPLEALFWVMCAMSALGTLALIVVALMRDPANSSW